MGKSLNKITLGLRRLCERQKPGECFSVPEIAEACGCSRQGIGKIERAALQKVTKRLLAGETKEIVRDLYPAYPQAA